MAFPGGQIQCWVPLAETMPNRAPQSVFAPLEMSELAVDLITTGRHNRCLGRCCAKVGLKTRRVTVMFKPGTSVRGLWGHAARPVPSRARRSISLIASGCDDGGQSERTTSRETGSCPGCSSARHGRGCATNGCSRETLAQYERATGCSPRSSSRICLGSLMTCWTRTNDGQSSRTIRRKSCRRYTQSNAGKSSMVPDDLNSGWHGIAHAPRHKLLSSIHQDSCMGERPKCRGFAPKSLPGGSQRPCGTWLPLKGKILDSTPAGLPRTMAQPFRVGNPATSLSALQWQIIGTNVAPGQPVRGKVPRETRFANVMPWCYSL